MGTLTWELFAKPLGSKPPDFNEVDDHATIFGGTISLPTQRKQQIRKKGGDRPDDVKKPQEKATKKNCRQKNKSFDMKGEPFVFEYCTLTNPPTE